MSKMLSWSGAQGSERILIGITGCTSIIIAIRLLEVLEKMGIERHLI